MGYNTHVTGEITITPPLTWKEIQEKGYTNGYRNVSWAAAKLEIKTEQVETDEGTLTRRTGVAIVPDTENRYKAYGLEETVRNIIEDFPGHTFTGHLECFGDDPGDLWRLYATKHQVIRVEPEIIWPAHP